MACPIITKQQAEDFYDKLDINCDGCVSIQEMVKMLAMDGYNDRACADMFADVDKNCDGNITKPEFVDEVCMTARKKTVDEIFKAADKDGSDKICKEEMIAYLKGIGATENAMQNIDDKWAAVDTDGSGSMDKAEFAKMMEC